MNQTFGRVSVRKSAEACVLVGLRSIKGNIIIIIIIIITLLTCQVCLAEGKPSTNRGHLIDN